MNPVRYAILGVAAVCAIAMAWVLRNLTTPHTARAVPVVQVASRPMARVLVATHDLPVGLRLTDQDMSWQPWPADSLNPNYISDGTPAAPPQTVAGGLVKTASTVATDVTTGGGPAMQALRGAVVREAIVKGEPIVRGEVVIAGQGGYMSVRLGPGMRAISVAVSAETAAGGFIQPGDKIDLIVSRADTTHKGGPGFMTEVVLSNVRVLAVDQTTGPAKNGQSIVAATMTLEVPAVAATQVAEARARGGVMLALRSYADTAGGPGTGGVAAGTGVRLIKGGDISEAMVSQ